MDPTTPHPATAPAASPLPSPSVPMEIAADIPAGAPPVNAPGDLLVRGAVRTGVTLAAGGSITVLGSVENATLQAGGDITVLNAVVGGRESRVTCGGSLRARLINNATIEAGRDVLSELEIAHSRIVAGGAVRCPIGHILGGHITANGGVTCGLLGSPGVGGAPTLVEVGIDECIRRLANQHAAPIMANLDRIAKVRTKVQPLMAHLKHLSAAQKETATELLAEAATLEAEVVGLAARLRDQVAESQTRSVRSIFIAAGLHPGTTIRFPVAQMIAEKPIRQPARITAEGKSASAKITVVNPQDRQPTTPKFSLYTDGPSAELQRALISVEQARQPVRKAA